MYDGSGRTAVSVSPAVASFDTTPPPGKAARGVEYHPSQETTGTSPDSGNAAVGGAFEHPPRGVASTPSQETIAPRSKAARLAKKAADAGASAACADEPIHVLTSAIDWVGGRATVQLSPYVEWALKDARLRSLDHGRVEVVIGEAELVRDKESERKRAEAERILHSGGEDPPPCEHGDACEAEGAPCAVAVIRAQRAAARAVLERDPARWELRGPGIAFALSAGRSEGFYRLSNNDLTVEINLRPSVASRVDPERKLNVDICGKFEWRQTTAQVAMVETLTRVVKLFGTMTGELEAGRVDLAADVMGWRLQQGDHTRIVPHGYATKITEYVEMDAQGRGKKSGRRASRAAGEGDQHRREWVRARRVTGYVVGSGKPCMAVVYDKREELARPGNEDKRAMMLEVWRRSKAYLDDAPVARVEFRAMPRLWAEFACGKYVLLRDLLALRKTKDGENTSGIGELWKYFTRVWMTEKARDVRAGERATRVATSPRWQALAEHDFAHQTAMEIPRRLRKRGAPLGAMALGCMRGLVAARGVFELPLPPTNPETGKRWASWREFARDVRNGIIFSTPENRAAFERECRDLVQRHWVVLVKAFYGEVTRDLTDKLGTWSAILLDEIERSLGTLAAKATISEALAAHQQTKRAASAA